MIQSLLYVSRSTLVMPTDARQLTDIVEVSRSRNATLDVTGALVFTEAHFAQVLEGSKGAIDALMTSIEADNRHNNVEIIEVKAVAERTFPEWSMAYSGSSFFVSQLIQPLVGRSPGASLKAEAGRLVRMMREFAR